MTRDGAGPQAGGMAARVEAVEAAEPFAGGTLGAGPAPEPTGRRAFVDFR